METFPLYWPLRGNSLVTGEFPAQRPVTRSFVFFDLWIKGWVYTREGGELRRHRAHYDVIVNIYIIPAHKDVNEVLRKMCKYNRNFLFLYGYSKKYNDPSYW